MSNAAYGLGLAVNHGSFAEYHRPAVPLPISINADGVTFEPITGMTLALSTRFSVANGILTYEGLPGAFLLNGTSDLEVNKATDITYEVFIDGVVIPDDDGKTTTSFTAAGKKRNISITGVAQLNTGTEIEIRTRGDGTSGVTLTINKLDLTFAAVG